MLEHSSPLPLGALAAAGMSGANAHAYLVSYGTLGLVRQDPASGHYELGPLALQLAWRRCTGSTPSRSPCP